MTHKTTKNAVQRPVIERFENENVIITRFLNGETITEFKPNCDPKVIKMYYQLQQKESYNP